MTSNGAIPAQRFHKRLTRDLRRNRIIYAMGFLCLAYYIIFCYLPMGGIVIAFKNFRAARGIFGSAWADPWYKYFDQFFGSYYFWRLLRNTLLINFYDLLFGFPAPILLALLLNELRSNRYKRVVQTVTYMPHFISQVVVCGIILDFFSSNGLVNQIIQLLGGQMTIFMQDPKYFRGIYVGSNIWQEVGYSSIIYLSALSAVDMELYDAAAIDGCNRFKRVLHVTLPGIMPTIVIMLILRMGSMMSLGFEKIILLYNESIYETSDVIASFVYRYGMQKGNYSYATAVGLFNSLFNFLLLILVNGISRKVNETSLW
ncbi:MAG TPA: ABC transporter permease subunit [Candidatus Limiplasma sp.]|nr:ABC transporter permease subunit [Candidatus Limiplasma sp.]HPR76970.1 ABC transporter permease subunit [Candidatus Limiplasma sp.]